MKHAQKRLLILFQCLWVITCPFHYNESDFAGLTDLDNFEYDNYKYYLGPPEDYDAPAVHFSERQNSPSHAISSENHLVPPTSDWDGGHTHPYSPQDKTHGPLHESQVDGASTLNPSATMSEIMSTAVDHEASSLNQLATMSQISTAGNLDPQGQVKVEDLLLPYYFIALSKYPHRERSNNSHINVFEFIQKALKMSSFNLEIYLPSSASLFFTNSIGLKGSPNSFGFPNPQKATREGFLQRFCLRNAAFLTDLERNDHDLILTEMTKTLDWLYQCWSGPEPKSPDSPIALIVAKLLSMKYDEKSHKEFIHKNGEKPVMWNVTKWEATQNQAIIFILQEYYRSTNSKKWDQLFSGSNTFLKYYARQVHIRLLHRRVPRDSTHWKHMKGKMLLPWEGSKYEPPKENDETLFNTCKLVNEMMYPYLQKKGKSWKQLVNLEELLSKASPSISLKPSTVKKRKNRNRD